ncbi:MAG: hypothetical protein ACHQEB_01835, partial [Chitinophagales bacterium]
MKPISRQSRFIIYFFWALISLASCNNKETAFTKLSFHIHFAYGHKVYLETVAAINEKTQVLDSALIKNGNDLISFNIPKKEEGIYRAKVIGTDVNIIFIGDSPEISIDANILHPQDYRIDKSPATIALKIFMENQAKLMGENRKKSAAIDSLRIKKTPQPVLDSLTHQL